MCCDPVLLVSVCSCISLFDGLNDPFADMASYDALYGSFPMDQEPSTPYPLDTAWVVWPDKTFSLVPPDWDEWYLGLWSILEPGTEAGSWPKIRLPVTRTPTSDAKYFLFWIHTCQTRHLVHGDMIAVALKPMLTGTLFSSSAILDQWRHRKFFLYHRLVDANGGFINADRTRCSSHLCVIRHCTGPYNLNALMSSLMCGSAAGLYMYFQ